MSERAHRLLTRLAGRAAGDPAYLGWVLDRYRASEGLSTSALAALLRIGEDSMPNLSLCLRPRAERFAADVLAVATHVGADATVLAALVRHVDAVDAMATGSRGAGESGFLLAARARDMRSGAEPNPAADHPISHEPTVPPADDRNAGGRGTRRRRDEEGP